MSNPSQINSLPGSMAPPPLIAGVVSPSRYRTTIQLVRLDTKVVLTARRRIDNTVQPDDLYYVWIDGMGLDLIALKFYGDPTLWWVIADYNLITDPRVLLPGTTLPLRFPDAAESA